MQSEKQKMNVVIYARVSSTEQLSGYSIEAQIDQARKWAAERGYTVVRVYVEPGRSASTDDRPTFQRMIKNLCAGEAQGVVVHKVDRFARNLLDLLQYKKRLRDNQVSVFSVVEEFLNGDSPENDLVLRIIGATAEYVARNIGQEAQKGQDAKARAGRWPGSRVPVGYVRSGRGREAVIEICPDRGPMIREAFQEFASGRYTLESWSREARQRGYTSQQGKPINRSSWHLIFRNNFYIGKFTWKGQDYDGDHPALVDQNIWRAVQMVLDDHGSGGAEQRHFWLLRGLLWSEVHARPMSGQLVKGRFAYYRAKPRTRDETEHNIRAGDAERQAVALLASIRWDGETAIPAPDKWAFGVAAAPDLSYCYPHLMTDGDRREFLRLVFLRHGFHVNAANVVSIAGLKPGFEIIE